ncbi:conserved hypothetical protein [Burkholderiales bacterium 8X]|nr:conserved hypothetical protein [Burkholderiales bacterium 8X]
MQMDFGTFGLVVLMASGACTFLLARWLGNRWRQKRRDKQRAAAEAQQSRQVRRARERQRGRER